MFPQHPCADKQTPNMPDQITDNGKDVLKTPELAIAATIRMMITTLLMNLTMTTMAKRVRPTSNL